MRILSRTTKKAQPVARIFLSNTVLSCWEILDHYWSGDEVRIVLHYLLPSSSCLKPDLRDIVLKRSQTDATDIAEYTTRHLRQPRAGRTLRVKTVDWRQPKSKNTNKNKTKTKNQPANLSLKSNHLVSCTSLYLIACFTLSAINMSVFFLLGAVSVPCISVIRKEYTLSLHVRLVVSWLPQPIPSSSSCQRRNAVWWSYNSAVISL